MDNQSMQQIGYEALKKRFGNKKKIESRAIPKYPQGVEREYLRLVDSYMALFNNTLSEFIPKIRDTLELGLSAMDAIGGQLPPTLTDVFNEVLTEFNSRQEIFVLNVKKE